ncbi:hypothetical protein JL721_8869 [Aureococcus anophagefferens]|nr:hypothetical protein JL721_8869 [Aureococcus anophagefferens]
MDTLHRAELESEAERHKETLSQAAFEYEQAVKATLIEKDEEHAKLLADAESSLSASAEARLREADELLRFTAFRAASKMADGVLTRGAIQGVLRSFRVWAMYTHMAGRS